MATSSTNTWEEEKAQKNTEQLLLLQKWNPQRSLFMMSTTGEESSNSHEPTRSKNLENTAFIRGEFVEFQLLEKRAIEEHMNKYRHLHFGLVQVAVKPLTASGLNSSVLICLRDRRCLDFSQSLLAVAQSKLSDGPIYFNCYPSYSVSLTDPHILKTINLSIKTNDLQEEGSVVSDHIAVFYRVYYRVSTDFLSKSKVSSSGRKTTFVETNLLRNDRVKDE